MPPPMIVMQEEVMLPTNPAGLPMISLPSILSSDLSPDCGKKGYTGIYRANLLLEKLDQADGISDEFKARTAAEAKFLRAFYYFDLVRFLEIFH